MTRQRHARASVVPVMVPARVVATVFVIVLTVVAVAVAFAGCGVMPPKPSASTDAHRYLQQLDELRVLPHRPDRPGFDRRCGRGSGCVFGQPWSDNVSTREGHDGCDQASNKLQDDLEDKVIKPGTRGCVVLSGTLHDPYTGATIRYVRGQRPVAVSVDHIVPLKLAWDLGADDWTLQQRRDFSGDPLNLVVVSASANSAKGDSSPADRWKPVRSYQCRYGQRFVEVLHTYRLPVSARDKSALVKMLRTCP